MDNVEILIAMVEICLLGVIAYFGRGVWNRMRDYDCFGRIVTGNFNFSPKYYLFSLLSSSLSFNYKFQFIYCKWPTLYVWVPLNNGSYMLHHFFSKFLYSIFLFNFKSFNIVFQNSSLLFVKFWSAIKITALKITTAIEIWKVCTMSWCYMI